MSGYRRHFALMIGGGLAGMAAALPIVVNMPVIAGQLWTSGLTLAGLTAGGALSLMLERRDARRRRSQP